MKKGWFPKFFIKILFGGVLLWPLLGYPNTAYEELKQRDLHYLEHLKKELEKAESMPGGLDRAREIKRRIETIERGTDIHLPAIKSFPESEEKESPIFVTPLQADEASTDLMTLTESSAGNELDLFHDRTVTVGEDYGVPASDLEAARKKSTQDSSALYKRLEMPEGGDLKSPGTAEVLYGAPRPAPLSGTTGVRTVSPVSSSKDQVSVDAPYFQPSPQPLYGTPPGYQPVAASVAKGRVVPTVYQEDQKQAPWKGDQGEVTYLEEKLKTKLAQLAHARKKLKDCTGQEAGAWTSRIYDLETEKRSLLRMMKTLGVTPEITKVSLEEDTEFDTIQSEEYQIIRQLNALEKQEKKVRRQMRFSKDPEVVTNAGDLLSRLEQNRKLLEASLKTLKINTASVDPTAFVARPTIYQPLQESSLPESTESMDEMQQVKVTEEPRTETVSVQVKEPLESKEIDIMEDIDDDECPLTENTGFWTSNVPNNTQRPLSPVRTPSRPNKDDVRQLVTTWKAG